jgi:hypothetical protein
LNKKYTLEYVKKYFKDNGCELIEEEYIGANTLMRYKCSCSDINKITFSHFRQGQKCKKCGYKKITKKRKFTLEYVNKYFEDRGCRLLDNVYVNSWTPVVYLCENKHLCKIRFANFKSGARCGKCVGNQKYTLQEVKKIFEDNGCELLETDYKNNSVPMAFRCYCGVIGKTSLTSFKLGARCGNCRMKKIIDKQKHPFEYVKKYFKDNGYELLETDYKNAKTVMRYRCPQGHISKTNFDNFKRGKRCKECYDENNYGENSNRYNPNLTDKDREDRRLVRGYRDWVKSVYKKDGWVCRKCKMQKDSNDRYKKIHAHHIEGYAENKKLRMNIGNGITFCRECHNNFHSIYGNRNVNRQQLNEFLKIGVKNVQNFGSRSWDDVFSGCRKK